MKPKGTKTFVPQPRRSRFVVTASLVAALTSGGAALAPALALADELPDAKGDVAVETVVVETEAPASEPLASEVPSGAADPAATGDPAAMDPAASDDPAAETPAATDTPSNAADPAATGDPAAMDPAASDDPAAENPAATETPSNATDPTATGDPTTENPADSGEPVPTGVPVMLDTEELAGETEVAEKLQADIVFVVDSNGSENYTLDDAADDVFAYAKGVAGDDVDVRFALYTLNDSQNGNNGSYYFVPLEDDDGVWTSDPAEVRDGLKGSYAAGGWGDGGETPRYVPAEMFAALYASEDGTWRNGASRYVVLISDDYDNEFNLYMDDKADSDEWPRGAGSLDAVAKEHLANQVRTTVVRDYIPSPDSSGNILRLSMVYWQSNEVEGDYLPGYSYTNRDSSVDPSDHMLYAATAWFSPDDPRGFILEFQEPIDPEVEAAKVSLIEMVEVPGAVEVNGVSSNVEVVAEPKLVKVAENVYEVERMPELDQNSLLAEAGVDASVYDVENYWWYVYLDGEKTRIMDANGNLAEDIDQVYWSPEDAAYVVRFKDGEKVLIAESSGKIVALTPKSKLGVDLVLNSSGGSTDGEETVPADTGSVYTPSRLPNTGSVYADKALEKIPETGDTTNAAVPATLTFAGVAAILAARARKESKQRDN